MRPARAGEQTHFQILLRAVLVLVQYQYQVPGVLTGRLPVRPVQVNSSGTGTELYIPVPGTCTVPVCLQYRVVFRYGTVLYAQYWYRYYCASRLLLLRRLARGSDGSDPTERTRYSIHKNRWNDTETNTSITAGARPDPIV